MLARRLSSACLAIGPTNSPLSIPLDNANQIFSQSTSATRSCHHHHHTFTTSMPNHQSPCYHPKHLRARLHGASRLASSFLTSSSHRSLCTVTHINPPFAFPCSSFVVTTLKPTEHRQHRSHICIQFLSTTGACGEAALNNNSNSCTCPMASRSSWFRPLKAGDVCRAEAQVVTVMNCDSGKTVQGSVPSSAKVHRSGVWEWVYLDLYNYPLVACAI